MPSPGPISNGYLTQQKSLLTFCCWMLIAQVQFTVTYLIYINCKIR